MSILLYSYSSILLYLCNTFANIFIPLYLFLEFSHFFISVLSTGFNHYLANSPIEYFCHYQKCCFVYKMYCISHIFCLGVFSWMCCLGFSFAVSLLFSHFVSYVGFIFNYLLLFTIFDILSNTGSYFRRILISYSIFV